MPGKRERPILFGSERIQNLLLAAYHDGIVRRPKESWNLLRATGITKEFVRNGLAYVALDRRHVAYAEIRAVLNTIGGRPGVEQKSPSPEKPWKLDWKHPLGHASQTDFRVLLCVARAGAAIEIETIARRIPDAWKGMISEAVQRLVRDGVLTAAAMMVDFHPDLPNAYVKLVAKLGAHLAKSEPQHFPDIAASGKRAAAFSSASDSAPRLFESDVRLRNLMALAKYGAMNVKDIRRVTGVGHLKHDPLEHAPFGHGEIVRIWQTADGTAAALDPSHPAAAPLRRLLRKLETIYPLPPLARSYSVPVEPAPKPWDTRARLHLFGNPIPTQILLTIGVLRWTFEALSVEVAAKRNRQNVKRALRRLEDEGVLKSDRARRPGFGARIVRMNPAFSAAKELEAVIRAYLAAWPDFTAEIHCAVADLEPKTKAYLRNQGLGPVPD